jgi:hypothetical protein
MKNKYSDYLSKDEFDVVIVLLKDEIDKFGKVRNMGIKFSNKYVLNLRYDDKMEIKLGMEDYFIKTAKSVEEQYYRYAMVFVNTPYWENYRSYQADKLGSTRGLSKVYQRLKKESKRSRYAKNWMITED